jgi:hypothetical protein
VQYISRRIIEGDAITPSSLFENDILLQFNKHYDETRKDSIFERFRK